MADMTGYATIGMLVAIAKNMALRYGVTNIADIQLDAANNGIKFILTSGDQITVPFDAGEMPFIAGSSGLTANNVQDAIYEVVAKKLDKNLGIANEGKILSINAQGSVEPIEPIETFEFTAQEFNTLNQGNTITINSQDSRYGLINKDILRIKTTGVDWAIIANKQTNTSETIAYTFLDYKQSQAIIGVYFLAFIPGQDIYTVQLISVQGTLISQQEKAQITTNASDITDLQNNKQDKNIVFTNITVNSNQWVANDDENFPYKAVITLNGIDGTMYPQLTLLLKDSVSGDLASICETDVNSLIIYSQKEKTITIPVILIIKTLQGIDYEYEINGAGGYTMTIEEIEYTLTPNIQGGETLTIDLGGNN